MFFFIVKIILHYRNIDWVTNSFGSAIIMVDEVIAMTAITEEFMCASLIVP